MPACDCHPHVGPIRIGVITLSDTREESEDRSGARIVQLAIDDGHQIVCRRLMRDDAGPLTDQLRAWVDAGEVQVIITTGGTGIASRDQAIEAVRNVLDVELPGFGEYFRALSVAEIGPQALLSRAVAGRSGGVLIFALPGSTGAVTTAMTRCVLPILTHAVALAES